MYVSLLLREARKVHRAQERVRYRCLFVPRTSWPLIRQKLVLALSLSHSPSSRRRVLTLVSQCVCRSSPGRVYAYGGAQWRTKGKRGPRAICVYACCPPPPPPRSRNGMSFCGIAAPGILWLILLEVQRAEACFLFVDFCFFFKPEGKLV